MSARNSYSYVPFYMSDWAAGTAHMTRVVKSVYFDVCFYCWDKAKPVPPSRLKLMLADLGPQGDMILEALVADESLVRNEDGSVYSNRALAEAQRARDLWERKVAGAKKRHAVHKDSTKESSTEQEQEQEPDHPTDELVASGEAIVGEPSPTPAADEGDGQAIVVEEGDVEQIVRVWNAMAYSASLPTMQKMTDARRKKLRARIKEHGADKIVTAIWTIPESSFLTGKNERGWKANFGWLLQPESCAKLIEGGYANGQGQGSAWTS